MHLTGGERGLARAVAARARTTARNFIVVWLSFVFGGRLLTVGVQTRILTTEMDLLPVYG